MLRGHRLPLAFGLTTLILSTLLLVGWGCRPATPATRRESAPITLTLLIPGGSLRDAVSNSLVRFRSEHPDVNVEVLTVPGRDYYVKALAMMAAGSRLDVLWMGQGFGMFAARGALLDLHPYLTAHTDFPIHQYEPGVVEWYRYRSHLYGIPYGIDLQATVINLDAFARAGIAPPNEHWHFDDYLQRARALSIDARQHSGPLRYGAGVDIIRPFYFGLSLLNAEGNQFGLHGREAEEWLALNLAVFREERTFLRVGAEGTLDRLSEFLQGRVAMAEVYSWDLGELSTRSRERWQILPNPIARNGKRVGWGSSSGFSITRKTPHPDLAWLLLKELVGESVQRHLLSTTVPARRDLQPAFMEAYPQGRAFLEMLPHLETPPRIAELQQVQTEWDYWFQLALQGKHPPKFILHEAQDKVNTIISTSPLRLREP